MPHDPVLSIKPLGFPWETVDPFLFCVHHDDAYPAGEEHLGPPPELLRGRNLGQDFVVKDGFRMYHGREVPGFPGHPHRGFETVTLVRKGLVDHSDSLGATARFGGGDAQWITAGKGIVHAEMFPLLERDRPNPLELFQIWLNLPAGSKMVEPHFAMLWSDQIPLITLTDDAGRKSQVALVAGALGDSFPPAPPPRSWAARKENEVAIWTLALAPHAKLELPGAVHKETRRSLYFFEGDSITLGGRQIASHAGVEVRAGEALTIVNDETPSQLLMLQGRPIAENVAQYGPFVMNSEQEIRQAMMDFRRTGFGGWPFPSDAPTHAREAGRFARHADGRIERK